MSLLLEVGGELHRDESVDSGVADVIVAALRPGILAAADRAVADVHHVLDRAPDDALGAGVGAAADRHHAGHRLDVGLHVAFGDVLDFAGDFILAGRLGDREMLARGAWRICRDIATELPR